MGLWWKPTACFIPSPLATPNRILFSAHCALLCHLRMPQLCRATSVGRRESLCIVGCATNPSVTSTIVISNCPPLMDAQKVEQGSPWTQTWDKGCSALGAGYAALHTVQV